MTNNTIKLFERLEKNYKSGYDLIIHTGLSDKKAEEILKSVIGQMSDGIWENSRGMERYWTNCDIGTEGTELTINIKQGYGSGFYGKSEEQIKNFFANKIKQIAETEIEDGLNNSETGLSASWNRNDTTKSTYLSYKEDVTIQDAYRVYDKLLGR